MRSANQQHLSCKETEVISDYSKKVLETRLLDHLTVEIKKDLTMLVFQFIVVLLLSHQQWCLWFLKINWKEKVSVFADLFKSDFPCPKALDGELDSWETYWLKSKD